TNHRIVLLAIQGFSINGGKSVVSDDFTLPVILDLTIEAKKTISPNLTSKDIELLKVTNDLNLLKRLFEGDDLTVENLLNINVKVNEEETVNGKIYQVVFEPLPGVTINGLRKLESIKFRVETVLEIAPIDKALILSASDIKNNTYKTLNTVKKLFEGVDDSNFANFNVTIDNTTPGGATTHTITLEANEWFTFNEGKMISITFTLETILNIKPINNDVILSLKDVENQIYSLETLQKLFNNINESNYDSFTIIINNNHFESESEHVITLTRKDGYIFENDQETISKQFRLDTYLNIIPNEETLILSSSDIKGDTYKTLKTLEKLFDGVNAINFANFSVTIDNTTPGSATTHTITLTGNYGFAFSNGEKTISKTFKLETILNITPKTGAVILNANEIKGDSLGSITTLEKLFNNIKENDLNNITVTIDNKTQTSGSKHTITLTRKDGFIFGNDQQSISKEFNLETVLNITPKTEAVILNANEIKGDSLGSIRTLEKLFNNIKENDLNNITVTIDNKTQTSGSAHTITLTRKDGFIFNDNQLAISKEFNLETVLNITPKTEAVILNANEIIV
ncbi:MAG: hypothetical protein ACRC9F_01935, partial [Metamycoplasmataceae bacterium]